MSSFLRYSPFTAVQQSLPLLYLLYLVQYVILDLFLISLLQGAMMDSKLLQPLPFWTVSRSLLTLKDYSTEVLPTSLVLFLNILPLVWASLDSLNTIHSRFGVSENIQNVH